MFGTKYDLTPGSPAPTHSESARNAWTFASHRFKENWLRRKGFRVNHSKIPGYLDLPIHVRDAWEADNAEEA